MRQANLRFMVAMLFASSIVNAAETEVVKVLPEGGLASDWIVKPGTDLGAPGFPREFAGRGEDVCIAMGYRVQADGTTSDFVLLRGWNSSRHEIEPVAHYWDTFGRASVGAIQKWRFEPRPDSQPTPQAPVDTVAIMTFHEGASKPTVDLRSRCAVPDLVARMQYVRRIETDGTDLAYRTTYSGQFYYGRQALDAREAREAASGSAASSR